VTTARAVLGGAALMAAALSGCAYGDTWAASDDDELVDACVELVQFQVYTGEATGTATWQRAGATLDGLRAECGSMADADVDAVRAMSAELDRLEAYLASHAAPVTAPPAADNAPVATTQPGCHSSYGDCVPIADDVDCSRERGADGPAFVALSVIVFGDDPYDLDTDGDGLGCEPGQPSSP
jgi:hypothetical protein